MLCHIRSENQWENRADSLISGASHRHTLPVDIFLHPVDQAVAAAAFIIKPPSGKNQGSRIQHTITKNAPYVPTSLVIDDFVFVLSDAGIASAIDLKSGILYGESGLMVISSPLHNVRKIIFACSTDGKGIYHASKT